MIENKYLKNTIKEYVQGTQDPTKRSPSGQSWKNLKNKINNKVSYYNPEYKYPCVHTGINNY